MPYPNEHACRLQDPKKYDTCRRGERIAHKPESVNGKKYSVIYCKKGDGPMEQQAFRYPKDNWTAAQARGHCKLNEGTFEPAEKNLGTKRLKLTDVYPERAKELAEEYGLKAEEIELTRKVMVSEKVEIDSEEKSVVSYINTASKDRDNEIIDPRGAVLTNYWKNPIVPWGHDYRSLPVGKNVWIKRDKNGLIAKTVFLKHPFALDVARCYTEDIAGTGPAMKAWSIGFIPLKWEDNPEGKKGPAKEGEKDRRIKRKCNKWELVEYSAVMMPSNPEALTVMVQKGLIETDRLKKHIQEFKEVIELLGEETEHMDEETEGMEVVAKWGAGGGAGGYRGGRSRWRRNLARRLACETIRQNVSTHRRYHMVYGNMRGGEVHPHSAEDVEVKTLPTDHWEDGKVTPMELVDVREAHWITIAVLEKQMAKKDSKLDHPRAPDWARAIVPKEVATDRNLPVPEDLKMEMNIDIGDSVIEGKAATPHVALPLMPEGEKWNPRGVPDSKIIEGILGRDPGDGEWTEQMTANAKKVTCWWDGKGGKLAAFKLNIGRRDPITDKGAPLKYNWRQTAAQMATLLGARGGVDIPGEEKKGVYDRLVKVYEMFDKDPPKFKEYTEEELKEMFPGISDEIESKGWSDVKATEYRLAYHIKPISLKEYRATVELLREGEWKHEDAPDGLLKVPLSLMQEFIQNFRDKVCGEKLPLDYGHEPDDKAAPGWITGMRISGNGNGDSSIFATLDITDPEARDNIKNGSLCYISPQLFLGWEDPESGKTYNVIRSAALTNYPLIKNMRKIVANFEEVTKEVKEMMTEEELKAKETELSEKETGFAERETKLTEGEETLEKEKKELEAAKLEHDKQTGPFYGLSKEDAVALAEKAKAGDQKAQDIMRKYATGEIFRLSKAELQEALKEVGINVELGDLSEFDSTEKARVEQLTERVDKLEKEKDAATANFKETVDKLSEVTRERRKEKVEVQLDELIRKGQIVPAARDTLRGILMADKLTDSIELEERDSSGKVTGKSKVSMGEAVLKVLELSPRGVNLGQEGVVTKRTAVDLAEGLKKLVGMSQAEFNKLEPEVQESLLKKIEGFKG